MMNRYIKSRILALVVPLLLLISIIFFVVTHRVKFEMKHEYILKRKSIPVGLDLKNLKPALSVMYIQSKKEFQNYKKRLQKHSIDTSSLPNTFDWTNYRIYQTSFFRLLELSYNPFENEYFRTGSEMSVPGEIYSGWCKFASTPVENRIYIYIGEKITYRKE